MIKKIISGGQTGADYGGLLAGRHLGLETGGTDPRGWRICCEDGTAWFGYSDSPGGRLTIGEASRLGKPCIINPSPEELQKWLIDRRIEVLNVAGNRVSSFNPGIETDAFNTLVSAIEPVLRDRSEDL